MYAQSEGKSFNFTYEDYTSVHVKKTKTTVTFLERVIEYVIIELVCELVSYASSKAGGDPILVNIFSRVLGYGSLSDPLGEGTYPVYTVTWTKYVTRKVAKETFRGGYTIYEDRPFKVTYSISYYFMNGEIVQIQSNGINDEYIAYCYGNRRR